MAQNSKSPAALQVWRVILPQHACGRSKHLIPVPEYVTAARRIVAWLRTCDWLFDERQDELSCSIAVAQEMLRYGDFQVVSDSDCATVEQLVVY